MNRLFRYLAVSILTSGLLAACGGSTSDTGAAASDGATPKTLASVSTMVAAAAASSTQWTFCANEGSRCIFTGNQAVRFGTGDRWVSKNFDWASTCNVGTFGDPAPGQVKHCEITSKWEFCANQNERCGFGDTQTVRYGTGNTFFSKTVTNGIACNNDEFGNPVPGVGKHCDRAATTWTFCADENGRCNFSGTKVVLYGTNGKYVTRTASNGVDCNNGVFGDPVPAFKACFIPGEPINDVSTPGNPPPPPPTGGTWNKQTTFNLVNGTRGRYADSQVYWAIIGKDWNTGKFVYVDVNGRFIPMSTNDNGALNKNGQSYTNYFHSIAQGRSITIPPLNSARLFLSVGSPMYIKVNSDINGNIGYAGANIENPADPNIDVIFDFVEMAIVPEAGFFGNTTRVDQFGFPVLLRLQGLNGYDQTVGETEGRDALYNQYRNAVPEQFRSLADSPYRIVAPAHATFNTGGRNGNYLDGYINDIWNKYRSQRLTFTNQQGTFSGQVSGDTFEFTDGKGTYNVKKPNTAMALLGSGTLADASGTVGGTPAYDKQLQIQAQLCAALNRHVVEDPANWANANAYYPNGQPSNSYSKFWHDHSVNRLAYGFAYDDVWEKSSSLHTVAPTVATVTIGW
ncbi:MAG: beta-1,3-glucanase family protein [Pseudomonadota bacterium]